MKFNKDLVQSFRQMFWSGMTVVGYIQLSLLGALVVVMGGVFVGASLLFLVGVPYYAVPLLFAGRPDSKIGLFIMAVWAGILYFGYNANRNPTK